MKTSYLVLAASLAVAVGSWMAGFEHWDELLRVQAVAGLLGIVGSVVATWLSKSPVKGTNGQTTPTP